MQAKEEVTSIHRPVNTSQRIIVAVIVPLVLLVVAYGVIDEIAFGQYIMRGNPSLLSDFHETWWMWAITFALLGVFEFFWLKTPKK